MERNNRTRLTAQQRIKFVHALTICVIVVYCAVQGYWLFGQYQHSLTEYENELYETIVSTAKEDIKQREKQIVPPRKTCSKMKINYWQDKEGLQRDIDWSVEVYLVDTQKVKLPTVSEAMKADNERYGLYLFDYLTKLYQTKRPDGIEFHRFHIGTDEQAFGGAMDAISRFYINKWSPFQPEHLDSMLRSRGIEAGQIAVEKADSMMWLPVMLPHRSWWKPVMTVKFPFDIFGQQLAVVEAPIGLSPIIQRMTYTLLATLLLSFFLIFCLVYQIQTIHRQRRIESIRQEFLHTMIHELKRPISTLKMCLSYIDHPLMSKDQEGRQQAMKSSRQELDNLSSYFSKLRDITLSDSGEIPLQKSDFNLQELIAECVGKQHIPYEKEVHFRLKGDKDMMVWADRMHLANVICNLLENAIKYSVRSVTVDIDFNMREGNLCQISIADNGIGMSKTDQRHVFDKFYRSESAKRNNIPGIGLGLSYVKLLVEAHGGSILLESTEGSGTVFTITIPQ